ncbi:ATP-binding protein [Acrocarpospora catenulata]|uniref:ATP-binding protein n=1 Tax=Acrocarpospora catenulata TaxID=2836182 RepID=UPI001BDB0EB7|nr:ATP-binding protein [Acrocarpospora catenulata]
MAAHPVSSGLARAYVRRAVIEAGRRDLADAAELVVAELVANAIRATEETKASAGRESAVNRAWDVAVGAYEVRGGVVVEVWDCSRMPPRLVEPAEDDESGRGLVLVGALSAEWGYRRPASGGKVVYATIEAGL